MEDEALLLDLARAVRSGKLHVSKVTDALKLTKLLGPSPALEATIADAIWFAWLECSTNDITDSASEPLKTRLADLAKELMKTGWISKCVLMEIMWIVVAVSRHTVYAVEKFSYPY